MLFDVLRLYFDSWLASFTCTDRNFILIIVTMFAFSSSLFLLLLFREPMPYLPTREMRDLLFLSTFTLCTIVLCDINTIVKGFHLICKQQTCCHEFGHNLVRFDSWEDIPLDTYRESCCDVPWPHQSSWLCDLYPTHANVAPVLHRDVVEKILYETITLTKWVWMTHCSSNLQPLCGLHLKPHTTELKLVFAKKRCRNEFLDHGLSCYTCVMLWISLLCSLVLLMEFYWSIELQTTYEVRGPPLVSKEKASTLNLYGIPLMTKCSKKRRRTATTSTTIRWFCGMSSSFRTIIRGGSDITEDEDDCVFGFEEMEAEWIASRWWYNLYLSSEHVRLSLFDPSR